MKFEIEYRNPLDLKFDPNNTNTHTEEQIEEITFSIMEFDFVQPVLIDQDDVLIAGEGRLKAAIILGMESIPAIRLEHLNHIQRRAYAIADNQLAKKSLFNEAKLLEELDFLAKEDMKLTAVGFTDEEIERLREVVAEEHESLLEAGKGQGESLDVAGESVGESELKSHVLRFGSRKVPMTQEEFEKLDSMYGDYVDEFGIPAGFVSKLMEG